MLTSQYINKEIENKNLNLFKQISMEMQYTPKKVPPIGLFIKIKCHIKYLEVFPTNTLYCALKRCENKKENSNILHLETTVA